jgi:hypothetical protein
MDADVHEWEAFRAFLDRGVAEALAARTSWPTGKLPAEE